MSRNHPQGKIFLLHNIVQMEERGRIRNRPFCSAHNEPFILYCLESKSLMCIECFNSSSLERRGHFLNIDVAHKICCDKLEKSAVNLRAFQSELREQCDLRRRLVDELEKNFDFMAKDHHKCDEIIFRVTQLKSFLLDKLDVEKTEKKDKIIDQLNNLNFGVLSHQSLSVSIFCSYASKIDLLHCYGDLSKLIQQFLSSNSQHLQKVKFDSNLNIDFAKEFNLSICQPLGFIPPPTTTENVLMSNKLIGNSGKTAKTDRHGSITQPTSTEINAPTSFEFLFGADSFILSKLPFNRESNTFNPMNSESDSLMEQRFMINSNILLFLFKNLPKKFHSFYKFNGFTQRYSSSSLCC
uniref:Uncharacterized protein n=1 Tax=Meloidogyne enterolobii TaxID=390850 RepID=A0A6V7UPG0_MELEN|nr:unnamed protein product [Meloidogyne enterolobii]